MKGKTITAGRAVRAIGCMTGTSLDGVDVAGLDTDGERIFGFGPSSYRGFSDNETAVLRAALGRWPGDPGVAEAAQVIEAAHLDLLRDMGGDLIGFHGQTLAHDPGQRGTHQTGNGARLARELGLPVAWDFRSADVAAGGQGAPLAPVFHFALAQWIGAVSPVVFLNLGGVGNITWVDPRAEAPFAPGAMLAFDTGPANAPINDLMRTRRGVGQDAGGALAAQGRPDRQIVDAFGAHPYFRKPPPKSLDRDDFAGLAEAVAGLDDADAAATLTEAATLAVARALQMVPRPPSRVIVCGGGRRNATLMDRLRHHLSCDTAPAEDAGLDGDMIEAQAFAYLAVRCARGLPISGPDTTGAPAPMSGGQLSWPATGRP
ncbi:anhydro-N-acetylmuramic acid kinase [Fluviibacterium sp. MJW13]|uniref:anhydro-N-acetylmuramic acid kinase n=1 Tax=Meridianimarinicoccus sp. MJW13 TaxID=2720031 RepID=UPI001D028B8D